MEKYHATQLIVKAFQEKKIRFRVEQLGRQEEIQAGFQVDCGPFVTVRFISLDDDNDVAIRALGIVGGCRRRSACACWRPATRSTARDAS